MAIKKPTKKIIKKAIEKVAPIAETAKSKMKAQNNFQHNGKSFQKGDEVSDLGIQDIELLSKKGLIK